MCNSYRALLSLEARAKAESLISPSLDPSALRPIFKWVCPELYLFVCSVSVVCGVGLAARELKHFMKQGYKT